MDLGQLLDLWSDQNKGIASGRLSVPEDQYCLNRIKKSRESNRMCDGCKQLREAYHYLDSEVEEENLSQLSVDTMASCSVIKLDSAMDPWLVHSLIVIHLRAEGLREDYLTGYRCGNLGVSVVDKRSHISHQEIHQPLSFREATDILYRLLDIHNCLRDNLSLVGSINMDNTIWRLEDNRVELLGFSDYSSGVYQARPSMRHTSKNLILRGDCFETNNQVSWAFKPLLSMDEYYNSLDYELYQWLRCLSTWQPFAGVLARSDRLKLVLRSFLVDPCKPGTVALLERLLGALP